MSTKSSTLHSLAIATTPHGLTLPVEVDGRPVRTLLSDQALQAHLGASTDPRTWLAAYRRHAGRVNRVAIRLRRAGAAEPVLLTATHFQPG
jgi:hypothetical protein